MVYMISQEEMVTLLDRPLSDAETADYENLLASAKAQLERLLGIKIDGESDTERTYLPRPMYTQLWTDPFTGDPTVSAINTDAETALQAMPAYFDDLNTAWYNSVILDKPMGDKMLTVVAEWGFGESLPADLAKLWAAQFDMQSASVEIEPTGAITSEQILTHKVTYAALSNDTYKNWLDANATVLARYAKPGGAIYGGYDALPRCD